MQICIYRRRDIRSDGRTDGYIQCIALDVYVQRSFNFLLFFIFYFLQTSDYFYLFIAVFHHKTLMSSARACFVVFSSHLRRTIVQLIIDEMKPYVQHTFFLHFLPPCTQHHLILALFTNLSINEKKNKIQALLAFFKNL